VNSKGLRVLIGVTVNSYMTQQLFNMCAVTAAKIAATSGESVDSVSTRLAKDYRSSYQDEHLAEDIAAAATHINKFLQSTLPAGTLVAGLTQMQFCIKHFRVDGSKRPFRLLRGAWFNKERAPLQDKVKQCVNQIAIYHIRVVSSSIPIALRRWHL